MALTLMVPTPCGYRTVCLHCAAECPLYFPRFVALLCVSRTASDHVFCTAVHFSICSLLTLQFILWELREA